ncbi:MAG: hypothetical protein KGL97_19875 [Alphaproteobacteria bacterium]|nr:hypothetical protein [Alphaproteobacteria bacterium]
MLKANEILDELNGRRDGRFGPQQSALGDRAFGFERPFGSANAFAFSIDQGAEVIGAI